ncbi:transmembrane protein, putative [Medicago truncatula]|uniref:Transmembrane protein, putative n=1 Tax=Medicago truncatula TaxID=3880 RepID=A2Q3Z4_MEDTR|nr:hypothetical protein MtrDRAFT_AC155891g2v1 [Medicago truncatula]AES65636.1 transmembrane protein, putative [Medicago truncatula]
MPWPPVPPGNLIRKDMRPVPAIRITSWTISSLVIPGMLLLYDLLHVRRSGRRSFIRWENTRVRDFGIPSHVARRIMQWSLIPISPKQDSLT